MHIIKNVRLIKSYKKYYPQTLLEKGKYVIRRNKMERLINDDLDLRSSEECDNKSDNESDNESDSESDN